MCDTLSRNAPKIVETLVDLKRMLTALIQKLNADPLTAESSRP